MSKKLAFQILHWVCAIKATIFRWDFTLLVDLYLDTSNFAASYYITQIQDGETRPLIYDLCILLLAEQNYNIYKQELAVIIKFIKKYSYMLNAKHQFIIHRHYKTFVGFLNVEYHKNIFAHLANKLRLFNIRIQYISEEKKHGSRWFVPSYL